MQNSPGLWNNNQLKPFTGKVFKRFRKTTQVKSVFPLGSKRGYLSNFEYHFKPYKKI